MVSWQSTWPAERDPSRHDVEDASQLPEPALLSEFKRALLSSSEARTPRDLMHLRLETYNDEEQFTYPAASFSTFPPLPPDSSIARLRQVFDQKCLKHVYLEQLPISRSMQEYLPHALRLAMACLASVSEGAPALESDNLAMAAVNLWAVIMEVDNRESRSPEMLMASLFLAMYGTLACSPTVVQRLSVILCANNTISRRMQFHNPGQLGQLLGPRGPSYSVATMSCLWLVDTLYALHHSIALSGFSSRELWIQMPSGGHDFQDTYQTLLSEGYVRQALPSEMCSQEDAVLLLIAILSDSLCLYRSLDSIANLSSSCLSANNNDNPFLPLSPSSERERIKKVLSTALDRWYQHFSATTPHVLSFYHYCRLFIGCPQIVELPRIARYRCTDSEPHLEWRIPLSDKDVRHAWLVLDFATAVLKAQGTEALCPVWLPVFVFHASLVVWAKNCLGLSSPNQTYGSSPKILLAFKMLIETMPWPCCAEMAMTLDRLMIET